jgi:hypothetical protein
MSHDDCPHCNAIVQFISEEKLQFSCGTTILHLPAGPQVQRSEICLETPEEDPQVNTIKLNLSERVVSYSSKFY